MDTTRQQHPRWTLDAFRDGAIATLPLLPGLCAFGIAFGTVAARKGFSLLDACLMSATVFSGVAQIIVVDAWPNQLTAATIFATAVVTALICSRFILIGASMRPWFGGIPERGRVYFTLYLLVEPPWLLGTRYYNNGGRDPAFVLGSCVVCWLSWVDPDGPRLLARRFDRRSAPLRHRPHHAGLLRRIMLVSMWQGPRSRRWLDRRQRCCGGHRAIVRRLLVRARRRPLPAASSEGLSMIRT